MSNQSAQSLMREWSSNNTAKQQAALVTKTAHGSASWASPEDFDGSGDFLMGRWPENGALLSYGGNGHCITFGPTGSGKGVSVVVPNLLDYPGSVVCIDPKGAIAPVTAARRAARGQKVILLDPFGEVKSAVNSRGHADAWPALKPASVNPFGHLNKLSPDVVDDARLIASGLVIQESEKNRYFSDSARMILEGLILYLLATRDTVLIEGLFDLAFKPRNIFVADVLKDMKELGEPKKGETEVGELETHIAHMAGLIENLTGDTGAAVWSTLYRSLNLLKSPRLLPAMQPSDVDFRSIKDTPTTVYLVLPARHLETHGVWLRLMLSILIGQLSDARRSDYPVLFIVDECAALGRLEILETAIGLMRGYGLKLWLIFQDLPQLKSVYAGRWESFISNSGVKQFFNVNDLATAEFVAQYLGNETVRVQSDTISGQSPIAGASIGATGRPLLTADEVRRLPEDQQILFYERQKPVRALKIRYYDDAQFKDADTGDDLFLPDPYIV
jgi:type IV secretion system protein VirD4